MPNPDTAAQNGLKVSCAETTYEVTEADLPVHCPMEGTTLWDSHPRVYIPLDQQNESKCPYCGANYKLIK